MKRTFLSHSHSPPPHPHRYSLPPHPQFPSCAFFSLLDFSFFSRPGNKSCLFLTGLTHINMVTCEAPWYDIALHCTRQKVCCAFCRSDAHKFWCVFFLLYITQQCVECAAQHCHSQRRDSLAEKKRFASVALSQSGCFEPSSSVRPDVATQNLLSTH